MSHSKKIKKVNYLIRKGKIFLRQSGVQVNFYLIHKRNKGQIIGLSKKNNIRDATLIYDKAILKQILIEEIPVYDIDTDTYYSSFQEYKKEQLIITLSGL